MWHDIPLWLTFLALSGAIFWCGLLGWFVWQPIAHLFEWFCDKDEASDSQSPIVHGQRYSFRKQLAGPWSLENSANHTVTVIDYKDGWVRYKFDNSSMFTDERMKEYSFRHCYELI